MDRGYECYNSIAHIEQKGMYYIIRAKDPSSYGIAASVKNQLPDEDTFDVNTSFYIAKKKTTDVKSIRNYIKGFVQNRLLISLQKNPPIIQ